MSKKKHAVPSVGQFRRIVYDYFRRHGRALPWRKTCNPYHIFISEVMLQQTQVSRVVEKYTQFLRAFPTVRRLARASTPTLLKQWQGLGYNRRALFLKQAAIRIQDEYGGEVPKSVYALETLPGIGKNTAASICAFAFNQPVVFVETNIRSVFLHHFFPDKKTVHDEQLIPLIEKHLDHRNARKWYSALMDYGVYLKSTISNPSQRSAHYVKQSRFEGSDRQIRGKILRLLLTRRATTKEFLQKKLKCDLARLKRVLTSLCRDKLITMKHNVITL